MERRCLKGSRVDVEGSQAGAQTSSLGGTGSPRATKHPEGELRFGQKGVLGPGVSLAGGWTTRLLKATVESRSTKSKETRSRITSIIGCPSPVKKRMRGGEGRRRYRLRRRRSRSLGVSVNCQARATDKAVSLLSDRTPSTDPRLTVVLARRSRTRIASGVSPGRGTAENSNERTRSERMRTVVTSAKRRPTQAFEEAEQGGSRQLMRSSLRRDGD
jgi:hypothetical protein